MAAAVAFGASETLVAASSSTVPREVIIGGGCLHGCMGVWVSRFLSGANASNQYRQSQQKMSGLAGFGG